MCGLVCCETFDNSEAPSLAKALEVLAHRGPDGQQYLRIPNSTVMMAHARLAIVGGAGGSQPLSNEDGTIWACVNGEFYGHHALRAQLENRGHRFKTHSDSEVLIHLYEEMGPDCLAQLHGEFAFALYDQRLHRWFCARDRAGIRPLQYFRSNKLFAVASEAKALFAMGVPARLDRASLWHTQHLQYLPQNRTLFEDIFMIPAGHFLLADSQSLTVRSYFELSGAVENKASFENNAAHAGLLLEQAVSCRIPADVPWACQLSGGLDSSIVSSLAQRYSGAGNCFTVKFTDDAFYDESAAALETAQFIGAQLHEVPITYAQMLEVMPKALYHSEGLSINGHLGAKYLLNKAIKERGFKVTLSGEGADELFMGYSHLKQDYLTATGVSSMEQQYLAGVQLPSGPTLDLSSVSEVLGFVPTWIAAKSSMARRFQPMWHESFVQNENPYASMLAEANIRAGDMTPLKTSSLLWMRYCLSGYILKVLDDAQAMAHGIEGRLPFLDTSLMEFLWTVPDSQFFNGNIEKALLRHAFATKVPAAVIARTKQSFMAPPLPRALANPKHQAFVAQYLLESPSFKSQQLFRPESLEQFLNTCALDTSPAQEPILMTLLSIAMLCENFRL